MTRNQAKEPYRLAGLASVHVGISKQTPLGWADSVHNLLQSGAWAPLKQPGDPEKTIAALKRQMRPDLVAVAIKAVVRGENELRVRALIRAIRLLAESKDAKDKKHGAELSNFLRSAWGLERAYEAAAEGEVELRDKLREEWDETQLPPPYAFVNGVAADEALVAAIVRRLG